MSDTLRDRQAKLQAELTQINAEISARKSRKMIQCAACGKRSRISSVTYIQTRWYEGPYGCTGGGSWHDGEGCFLCPKCGVRNRLLKGQPGFRGNDADYHTRNPYTQFKSHFKEVVTRADNELDHNFVNHHMTLKGKVAPGMNFSNVKWGK